MRIETIPVLADNYSYLVVCTESGQAAAIDPADAVPTHNRPAVTTANKPANFLNMSNSLFLRYFKDNSVVIRSSLGNLLPRAHLQFSHHENASTTPAIIADQACGLASWRVHTGYYGIY